MNDNIDETAKSWFQRNSARLRVAVTSLVVGGVVGGGIMMYEGHKAIMNAAQEEQTAVM